MLSSCDPKDFGALGSQTTNERVRSVLPFYIPKPKSELFDIWKRQRELLQDRASEEALAEDERVEDAGLDQELAPPPEAASRKSQSRKTRAVA